MESEGETAGRLQALNSLQVLLTSLKLAAVGASGPSDDAGLFTHMWKAPDAAGSLFDQLVLQGRAPEPTISQSLPRVPPVF